MKFSGTVFRYGRDVDTDVIIPARYLNSSDHAHLAAHAMEDIDPAFATTVKPGDIIVADENFGCGSSREHAPPRSMRSLPAIPSTSTPRTARL